MANPIVKIRWSYLHNGSIYWKDDIFIEWDQGYGTLLIQLTQCGQGTHICISKLTIIVSDNGLVPDRHQAIIGTNAGILLIRYLGTNISEIWIEIN